MPEPQIVEPGLKYRPEIDGLRAIAVLGVLASHFGVPLFQGGFIGVDVFFVISGFLITRLISAEIEQRNYSIWKFYERRARRILPALFFMLFFTTAAAVVLLFPTDLLEYTRSLFGTVLFVSNVEFWHLAQNYFAVQRQTQPLLHTWSLGVEEQFYLFFPIILIVIARFKHRLRMLVLVLLALASFALSCWSVHGAPVAAFYLMPSRFWELACGSILAESRLPSPRSDRGSSVASLAGLGMILAAMILYVPEKTLFPGAAAILPCGGSALVIWGTKRAGSIASKVLGAKPIVFVGLISYSLYLWHWPLLVYVRYVRPAPTVAELSCAALVSVVMAVISWRWIEQPFRGASSKFSVSTIYGGL